MQNRTFVLFVLSVTLHPEEIRLHLLQSPTIPFLFATICFGGSEGGKYHFRAALKQETGRSQGGIIFKTGIPMLYVFFNYNVHY